MTLVWKYNAGAGDVNLPYPTNPGGFAFAPVDVAASWNTLDGTTKLQYFATKSVFSFSGEQFTGTERTTLRAMYLAGFAAALAMTFPDTGTGNYYTVPSSWNESEIWKGATPLFNISFSLRQV